MAPFEQRLAELERTASEDAARLKRELLTLATDDELHDAIEILTRREQGEALAARDVNRLAEIAANLHERHTRQPPVAPNVDQGSKGVAR